MRGVFLDSQTLDLPSSEFSILTSTLDEWQLFDNTLLDEVVSRIQDAEVVVTNKVPLTAKVLQMAPKLKCICICATGSDHVDLQAATRQQVVVCNVAGYSTQSVVQLAIGFILNLSNQIDAYAQSVKAQEWEKSPVFCLQKYQTRELAGKVLGIIGYGAIGQGVAQVAKALGMTVLIGGIAGRLSADRVSLAQLLPQVDVLSLHCPLTENTRNLIDAIALSQMKSSAHLINVARGGLVNEAALADALRSGKIAGAALDVLTQEPPLSENPLMDKTLPNLIITPHIGWATQEAQRRLLAEVAENVRAFLNNIPRNILI